MSTEYSHSFISSLILGNNFDINEFDNFTAHVSSSTVPLFKNVDYPWSICFEIDDDKLIWQVIEYDHDETEDFLYDSGTLAMNGSIDVVLKDIPSDFHTFDLYEETAHEFIACLFPVGSEIIQLYPDQNMFLVNGIFYNFDTMRGIGTDKYIHFEFKN